MTVVDVKKWCGVQVVYRSIGHSKTWCSDGYGSVGKHDMRSDRAGSRKVLMRQDDDRVERVGWMVRVRGGTSAGKTGGNCRLGTGL